MTSLEINAFSRNILRKTGLDLSSYRSNQVERRLRGLMERAKATNLRQFFGMLDSDPKQLEDFLDRFAINVSELFRNPDRFEDLRKKVLPQLLNGRPLRIWSAGCSYGAEAFTVAIILEEITPGIRHHIIGTDLDSAALAHAQEARFTDNDVRCVPPLLLGKYFTKTEDGHIPSDALRERIHFKRQNLLADPFERNFDLILCRNVVIYFSDSAKDALYHRFFDSLKLGGVLFVGGTERVVNAQEIGYESLLPFFYRKPPASH